MAIPVQLPPDVFRGIHGGFWIDPDGCLIRVVGECSHIATLGSECGLHRYDHAFERGYVRISVMGGMNVEFTRSASVAALRAAVSLLRHDARPHRGAYLEESAEVKVASVRQPDGHWTDTEYFPREYLVHGEGYEDADKAAAKLASIALERNAAIRKGEAQLTLAA